MSLTESVMLIDDDADDQLIFKDAVYSIRPDLECKLLSNCIDALKYLEESSPPDFIFMDLNMPVMSGFECLEILKKNGDLRDIPVIIFSTSTSLVDINKTKLLGASWFMSKPDDFNVLCKKLNSIIRKESFEGQFMI